MIGILSKNNRDDAINVFREHKEMIIKESDLDFVYCNWDEKYLNLQKAAISLNLSIENFCFLDNSIAEREKMSKMLSKVQIIDLPFNDFLWATTISKFLNNSNCETIEDNLRQTHYKLEKMRESELKNSQIDDFQNYDIKKILEVSIKEEKFDLARAEQLFL